ncbi:MAG: AMP-binding protein [Bacillota bacterium]|nr:AMP-binding protein [Bacillota bacterium]
MKPVSEEEYKVMQERNWAWANDLIQKQLDDPRPAVRHFTNRPIISIKDMFESSHELYKDNIAFYTKFQKGPYTTITYDQYYNDVNALGTAFINLGLKEKRIAVIGETQYMWGVAYLATMCGTGVVVPLDKELSYDDLKNLIKESEASAVVFDKKRESIFIKMMEEGDTKLELLISQDRREAEDNILSQWALIEDGKKLIANGDRRFIDAQIDPEEMSVLLFTSGTTGMAKGVMLSHRNLCADLIISPTLVNFDKTDVFFSILPIHHTFECTCDFLIPIYKGSAIAHCEGLKYIVKNIQEVHPTILLCVPAIAEALHKAIWKGIRAKGKEQTVRKAIKISNAAKKLHIDLTGKLFKDIKATLGGNLRLMICGGAAINPQILEDLNSFGIMAFQGYGLTEASPMAALNPDLKYKYASIGLAFPGTKVKIANPAENGIGEICVKGDNIMLGYYKNQEATDEVLKDGWFYTGDLGYIDDEGYIFITGRKKNVIITKNGKNVFPEELEYQLSNYDVVLESMVFQDESGNKDDDVIVAGIYPDWAAIKSALGDLAESDEEVVKYLWTIVDEINETNPPYKMIKRINLRHTEFIKNTSKKIKRFEVENKKSN